MRTHTAPRARTCRATAVAVAALSMLTTLTLSASSASASPVVAATVLPAPTGLKAVRNPDKPNDFVVSWNAVDGDLDHYNVSVFQNGTDNVTVVPAGTTKLAVTGIDLSTTYRITVGTRDANGEGTTSGYYWLYPALPGSVLGLSVTRSAAGDSVVATWNAPTRPGYTPITGYRTVVTRLVDSVIVYKQDSLDLAAKIPALDPTRSYSVKVYAANSLGAGPVSTTTIASDRPGTPTSVTAVRDNDNPGIVHVKWLAPGSTGAGPIIRYEVVSGIAVLKDVLPVDKTFADIALEPGRDGQVAVRACNAKGCGYISPIAKVAATGKTPKPSTATTNPQVLVSYLSGVITVQTTNVIGSTLLYPRLVVRITPTIDNGGFRDTQWGQNDARVLTFSVVPAGNFTITVNGVNAKGAETELARKVIVTEGYGTVKASEVKVVNGKADVKDGETTMSGAGENRVLTTRSKSSDDMVIHTKAVLKSGSGYAVFVRASTDSSNRLSGLALQYDPVYANAFILRNWYQGKECATALAKNAYSPSFKEGDEHEVVVVAQGDSIFATVDGKEVFRIKSVSAAIAASPCKYPAPTGKRMGLRSWAGNSVDFREIEFD